ncbi:phosphatidylinositol glycan anchor biosynthesis class U protein-like [Penaeus japonicus]|uniref:phosphatidylinositol glycan anchor biosynthesis class U protein-like n=1 Tax=Penaeus japonicus TaxID=27405 RepID=UPI001C70B734|nr:phosphatidylinositol glycan anchor biosynthesis class U protein-like [Penaeus japonicus]XP_042856400.1 phosphatidylinositol glycan anchor biosynthesis class U protein-like [Penaeus japonicus]XP_042856404.1 phosphatidylinositol glycan anchor biosynthesis class U protein-like [Penaeus japonicus]
MISGVWLMYLVGAGIRLWLMNTPWAECIARRVELSTPLNSWKRVEEGVFLHSQGIAVYSGGVFHETPFCLLFGGFLIRSWQRYLHLIFVGCDLLTAALLASVASSYSRQLLMQQKKAVSQYASDASHLLLTSSALGTGVVYVAAAYLFCPYTIASCVAQTTSVFANLVIAAAFASMVKGYPVMFGTLVALVAYQSFYPICLMVPGILFFMQNDRNNLKAALLKPLVSFSVSLGLLMVISAEIAGGWEFLEATYGFILAAPDLTPNIGLFWYFFTEMFEHFRLFFLATFQINAFVYVLPLAIRLRKDPVLLATALLAFTAVFRSYPALGDVGIYLSLLPMWKHLYPFMRQTFIVGCMFVATSVLGPIMYNLWIFSGSANANFYFAVTLAFNTAQIFLVTDLLFAHVKREYHLIHGSKMEVDGIPARLILQ